MLLRKKLRLYLMIGCTLCTGYATAQMPNYMPVVQRDMMNFQFNNFMMRPMNFAYRNTKVQNHHFIVVMNDSTTIEVFGKINSDSTLQYLRWKDKSVSKRDSGRFKKIYPYQTKSITRDDKNLPEFTGISTDTCWLFKAITGRITGYSPIADDELTKSFVRYIQKDNGPVLEMNEDNLEAMMKDNDEALKFLKRKKYDKAIAKYNKSE